MDFLSIAFDPHFYLLKECSSQSFWTQHGQKLFRWWLHKILQCYKSLRRASKDMQVQPKENISIHILNKTQPDISLF
ncbi:unnamed protein product [Blepharisma stoltei]|uniref:Maturase K n=1 Tax=Blepharisma stoltei TaxID=1481888 RepID=A0AAU9JAT0_9CILI|nr:unnamed protein product [Blepharisma stoltei]